MARWRAESRGPSLIWRWPLDRVSFGKLSVTGVRQFLSLLRAAAAVMAILAQATATNSEPAHRSNAPAFANRRLSAWRGPAQRRPGRRRIILSHRKRLQAPVDRTHALSTHLQLLPHPLGDLPLDLTAGSRGHRVDDLRRLGRRWGLCRVACLLFTDLRPRPRYWRHQGSREIDRAISIVASRVLRRPRPGGLNGHASPRRRVRRREPSRA